MLIMVVPDTGKRVVNCRTSADLREHAISRTQTNQITPQISIWLHSVISALRAKGKEL